ncbi:hypothetical protein GmHk_15G044675 [Glycine max]|nr:hypothetical protein GmHk_15G044675 [Glycine max]
MWYHSSGNSLSVSTQHSHLGKLGNKCRGHLIVHRQIPSHSDQPEPQGSSKPSDMPLSASIFPHEKLQALTDNVYTISMQYEV